MRKLLLPIILIAFFGCDINNEKLIIINKTAEPVYYSLLADTALNTELPLYKALPGDTVYPNFVMGGKGAWEYAINKRSNDSTLHIFIFTSAKLTDDDIKESRYKRFDLKLKDLEALSWIFIYR
jgi:hypothetical protein